MTAAFRFTVYVVGTAVRTEAAQRQFRQLCAQRLPDGNFEITVIDVLEAFEEADAARILVTPTLVRTHPLPVLRVIGELSASNELADALELPPERQEGPP